MRANQSTKSFITGVAVIAFMFIAANAGSQTEPVFAGWAVGAPWDGYGTIVRSTDSGETWVRQGSAGHIANVHLNGVFAVDPLTAWVAGPSDDGYGTIYHTIDGGETWERKGSPDSIPDTELAKIHAFGDDVWAVGVGTILHSSDGGETWTDTMPAGYEEYRLQGVFVTDSNTAWATGGTAGVAVEQMHGLVFKTTDGGSSWSISEIYEENFNHLLGISAVDADTAWAVGGAGYVLLKTADGGETWTRQGYDNHQVGGIGDLNEVYAVDASTVWVAADSCIYWTVDGGENWKTTQDVIPGSLAYMGISAVGAQRAWASYAATDGYIASTTDGGESWSMVYPMGEDDNPGLWTVSFALQPVNPEPLTLEVGPGMQYTSIQSAVNSAREGDTILVYPGYYEESVLVTTNDVEILTAGDGVVVYSPDGGTAAFSVFADGVTIRGFGELTGIPDCVPGIEFQGSFNTFADNVINPGGCPGVNALMCRDPDGGSNFNRIENNTIVHGDLGIVITSESPDSLNYGNTIRNNIVNAISQTGIVVENGLGFRISGNTIPESVTGNCILVIGDNNVVQGSHAIFDNVITYCALHGIALWADQQTRLVFNQVSRNEISFASHGIHLEAEPEAAIGLTLITDNTVFRNQVGIVLEPGVDGNVLFRNSVVTQVDDGIQVNGDGNWIIKNTARGNGAYDLDDQGSNNWWWRNDYDTASWE